MFLNFILKMNAASIKFIMLSDYVTFMCLILNSICPDFLSSFFPHYKNLLNAYAINRDFHSKHFDVFNIFAQNINC